MKGFLLLILCLMLAATVQAKGSAEKGKAKAAQVCAACHGADGAKPVAPENPILAGQYPD
jgi:cytochrome c553